MKNIFVKALAGILLAGSASSCGDSFLDTNYYGGIDMDGALSSIDNVATALNGAYYRICQASFCGNYAYVTGDIASDIAYWNGQNNHQNDMYNFNYLDTYYVLDGVWNYGYKIADNSARIIIACNELLPNAVGSDVQTLNIYKGEAHAMRAYAMTYLVNFFGHQVKVAGQDFSGTPGVVIVNEPIAAFQEVSRSTVGECYTQILSDLDAAIAAFNAAGGDRDDSFVFGVASTYGLMARVKLYLEDWAGAADAATKALATAKITALTYDAADYKKLWANNTSNVESFLGLAIDQKTNWSANSLGTIWTTYCYSPSPYLVSLYGADDIRTTLFAWTDEVGKTVAYGAAIPWFAGGKYGFDATNNPANMTNYLIGAPEMFLIQAEANAQLGNTTVAADALLKVAKRNPAITATTDLPSTKEGLLEFVMDERARELFQEGFRFWDLRRWNSASRQNLSATGAPEIEWNLNAAGKIGDIVFPIPVDEINAGFGVAQNDGWQGTRPAKAK